MTLSEGFILLGFLTAIFPLMQFISTPILGQLSDKFGRKPILTISLIGTCISYLIFALAIVTKNIPLLFIARGFDGVTGGNISVAQAAIADITPPEKRARNFGLIGAAFGLGFVLGPYIGGKLSDPTIVSWFSAYTPFLFAALLSAVNITSVFLFFPETHKAINAEKAINWVKSINNIVHAYTYKNLRNLFATNFLLQGGFTFFTTFFSIYLITHFSTATKPVTQGNIGDFFAYVGLWIAFTQAVITRQVGARFSESRILKITLLGTGAAVFAFFFPTKWWELLLIVPFFAIFNGLTQANLTGLVSRSVDNSIQGEVLGIFSSVAALAQSIPPILSGYIAAKINPATPLLVAGVVIVFAGVFFNFFYRKPDHEISEAEIEQVLH